MYLLSESTLCGINVLTHYYLLKIKLPTNCFSLEWFALFWRKSNSYVYLFISTVPPFWCYGYLHNVVLMFQICSSTSWYIINKILSSLWNSLWNWKTMFVGTFKGGRRRVSVWIGRSLLSWKSSGFSLSKKITFTNYVCPRKNIQMLCGAARLEMYWVNHRRES